MKITSEKLKQHRRIQKLSNIQKDMSVGSNCKTIVTHENPSTDTYVMLSDILLH